MRELIAGEGGTVLIRAATSEDAVALACEGLAEPTWTPSGIPVYPTDAIPDAIEIDRVRIVESEPTTRQHVESWARARGTHVNVERKLSHRTPPGDVRVVAVSAVSTGSGKTALTRRVARTLARSGVRVCVARHPIAELLAWGRFDAIVVRSSRDLLGDRPITEREEIAPVVGTGVPVVVGLDPSSVLSLAAREAGEGGVVVWDGGGAAEPWVSPDLHLVAIDLLRDPPDLATSRLWSAHAVVLTKADSAPPDRIREMEDFVSTWVQPRSLVAPNTQIVLADLAIGVQPVNTLADKRVVIVEDANSLMLGGLSAGAGAVAASRFRCGVVDPRPFAVGAIARALRDHPHIGAVIPALGRTPQEIDDLAATVYATPGDAVLWASNADPQCVIGDERRPVVRAFGELTEVAGPSLQEVLTPLLPGHG